MATWLQHMVTTQKTINSDIYPRETFWLRSEHKFHTHVHCSGESVFLLKHSL